MNWLTFAIALLGEAEAIVPVFIHNPKTQAIEGVVVTTLNDLLSKMLSAGHPAAQAAAAATPAFHNTQDAAAPAPTPAVTNPNL